MLLLERHTPGIPIKVEFQQLISEGVQTVGLETMQSIKSRIYEGIIQQEEKDNGNDPSLSGTPPPFAVAVVNCIGAEV